MRFAFFQSLLSQVSSLTIEMRKSLEDSPTLLTSYYAFMLSKNQNYNWTTLGGIEA